MHVVRSGPLAAPVASPGGSGTVSWRRILGSPRAGWAGVAMGEWELHDAEFGDCHPHEEVNYVLAGELVVETADSAVTLGVGDTVRVAAGEAAWYSAHYARMLHVYGPNPSGQPSEILNRSTPISRPV